MATPPIEIVPPATGVRNPTRSATATRIAANPIDQATEGGKLATARYKTPCLMTWRAIAMRSSSSPRPGHPPGNVENSLCRVRASRGGYEMHPETA